MKIDLHDVPPTFVCRQHFLASQHPTPESFAAAVLRRLGRAEYFRRNVRRLGARRALRLMRRPGCCLLGDNERRAIIFSSST